MLVNNENLFFLKKIFCSFVYESMPSILYG
jgi:hypothetical protein